MLGLTDYHAKYFAHELTKRSPSDSVEMLAGVLADAQVDLNPHQIEAALFAFRNPFSRGAILADEVGLGKTIEAGLLLSQRWAERKRKLLIIMPANLRKQWSQELADKFHLPSVIMEARSFNEAIRAGNLNPFVQNGIVLCSYQFVRSKEPYVRQVDWDLVVIDEAHRLRNVYKTSSRIALAIKNAISSFPKVLLTATPLQNSLLELYGLVSIVDDYAFGDLKSFRARFARLASQTDFTELKERLKPLCKRTLRRQVLEYVPYTDRHALVQEFVPSDDEQKLYDLVSGYLQKPTLYALPAGQRQLMTLILRKLLASSTYAISGTLDGLAKKLEAAAAASVPVETLPEELPENLEELATLRPAPEESVNFDTTENLLIEGDNLEVLKLLQKSYLGKIKMIYIDPPYNTGNDFIYPDNYSESLHTYLQYTGQIDNEGRKFSTNTDSEGRFHSRWLNMMYPRLYLARNLLKDSGCIFISIDDVELSGLRFICDEIFGPEHFCGLVSRSTGTRMGEGSATLSSELDYILIYAKTDEVEFAGLPMTEDDLSIYDQRDEKGQYLTRSLRRTGGENRREDRPSMFYAVHAPDGTEVYPIAPAGYESRWVCSSGTYQRLLAEGLIEWKKVSVDGADRWQVYQKHYVGSATKQPSNLWTDEEGNKKATRDLNSLFGGLKVFDHPKPIGLVQRMTTLATGSSEGDIILDFFAGSGTTGHAVWLQNLGDQGNRSFIMVQLPERLDVAIKAHQVAAEVCKKLNLPSTVAELTKERMRRAFANIEEVRSQQLGISQGGEVSGFRVFKLAESNFKTWDADKPDNAQQLEQQLEMHVNHLREGRAGPDFLYEILLKSGFPLTASVEKLSLGDIDVYAVAGGALLICLDRKLTLEAIRAMAGKKPERVVCLDDGFAGNDQLKTNAVQTFKSKGIVFRTV